MSFFNRLVAVFLTAALIGPVAPLQAKTRKGDRYLAQGRAHEEKKEWDAALESYEQALSEDPSETIYQMAAQKARFQASQMHVGLGLKARAQGQLGDALLEFQKAFAIDPGSMVADQEIRRTQEMIQRERKRIEETGKESPPEQRALTPVEEMKRENQRKMDRMQPAPELKPTNPLPSMKISGQPVKVIFETIGKVGGLTVLWDPDYTTPTKNSFNVDFAENTTVEEALDYLSIMTKSYWKPLATNTIFVTNDNPNKRRDYAEMVAQTFYINNVSLPQEIQEIVNAVRSVTELQRVVAYNAQRAIIVRGEADQVALAGKMIHDLDKPRAEVVVDILVLEASSTFSRQITAAIASTGLNLPINFTPRSSIQVQSSTSSTATTTGTTSTGTTTGTTGTTTGTTGSSTTGTAIPLNQLGHLASSDFSTTLPGALLQAALSDAKTKVLQAPQLRAVDNAKASLKIGQKEPTASGSFQPGIGGVGINPLVNTQFTFIDVGVNVEILPQVHDNGDVSMHVDIDISNIAGQVNLGGINQPIIGQRHIVHDVRLHEGEVNLLAGLIQSQDDKTVTGIPGLGSIPILGRLFSGNSVDHNRDEIMIALIPHVIRRTEITPENLRGIAVGNATTIKLNYAPSKPGEVAPPKPAASTGAQGPVAAALGNAPVNPPATALPATAPPETAPPATAPPETAPPATAPPATAPPAAGEDRPERTARVRFSPAQVDTSVSSSITVAVTLDDGKDVAGAPMQIQFDPKILRLNDVVRGDFFSRDGQQPLFSKNILNDAGTASIQLNRMPRTPGISGGGVLVTLNFQAVSKGATAVTITNLPIKDSQGQAIAAGTPRLSVNVK
ncbi:Type II and III secretion system protein [Candidatus Sulfopaludibacter sp. SbA6]|nr:Type II and III secretion system protein [Candidatus Sulfopaludibacter sp. SbA6]